MIGKPPLIREHLTTGEEVAEEVVARLEETGFAPMGTDHLKDGLVHVFSRYCEILSKRLNRVPESYRQAFVGMIGAAPAPAVPARVPLSFQAVESSQNVKAIVPKFTQVSAPAEGEYEAVVFETPRDLPVVQATLVQAIAVDTRRVVHADVSSLVSFAAATGFRKPSLLADAVPMERAFHLSSAGIIGLPKLSRLHLKIETEHRAKLPKALQIEWGTQSKEGFVALPPVSDTTEGLSQSGEVILTPPPEWPVHSILGRQALWLTCRLHPASSPLSPAITSPDYPIAISGIEITGYSKLTAVPPAKAFNGGIPLDVSKDFFPLGERPRFGEVFYILFESFALPEARVIINIKLTNPAGAADSPIPPVSNKGNPRLRWEAYTTHGWVALDGVDGTRSLTQDGEVELLMPMDAEPATINAFTGGWLRARLMSGHYLAENVPEGPGSFPQMNPPSIETLSLTSVKEFGPLLPEHRVIESGLEFRELTEAHSPAQPFNPFPAPAEKGLLLYLGLKGQKTALAGSRLNLYAIPCSEGRRTFCRDNDENMEGAGPSPRWQVRMGSGWRECDVIDSTQGLRKPGMVEVHLPDDISGWSISTIDPQQQYYWARVVWEPSTLENRSRADILPCLRRVLLNTIVASQTLRLADELLGSSNGKPRQVFQALRKPIIGEVKLQVRELHGSTDNSSGLRTNEGSTHGAGSIDISRVTPDEVWVDWFEVEGFSLSDSRSRHFILDRLSARFSFGDGRNGRIPPPGANNVRLHEYYSGGGRQGNRAARVIAQLRTTIPYVDSVINLEPAAGGQDQESPEMVGQNATARIRHRDRAICMDDYAELARMAAPEVAAATCAATRDLLDHTRPDNETRPGMVSVIIVPYDKAIRPQPSFELLRNVKAFLDARRPVAVDLVVLGPEYVSINVIAEIAWSADYSLAGGLEECERRLERFLHPVTGGLDKQGWQFGTLPHASDFYPVLGDAEGLDHILGLELRYEEDRPGLSATRDFLVCSGKHEIRIC
jgi:predicted phage baseplate assembly protein